MNALAFPVQWLRERTRLPGFHSPSRILLAFPDFDPIHDASIILLPQLSHQLQMTAPDWQCDWQSPSWLKDPFNPIPQQGNVMGHPVLPPPMDVDMRKEQSVQVQLGVERPKENQYHKYIRSVTKKVWISERRNQLLLTKIKTLQLENDELKCHVSEGLRVLRQHAGCRFPANDDEMVAVFRPKKPVTVPESPKKSPFPEIEILPSPDEVEYLGVQLKVPEERSPSRRVARST